MKNFYLAAFLCLVPVAAAAQTGTFPLVCTGNAVSDTAKLEALISTTSPNEVTFTIPYKKNAAQRCTWGGVFTIPARITLSNIEGSGVVGVTASSITVAGPRINPPGKVMFSGPGAWILTGPFFVSSDDSRLSVVTASGPGLAPTLPNDPSKFLNGVGGYTVPAGSGGGGIGTLNGQTGGTQSFGNSTNVTWASVGNVHTATLIGMIDDALLSSNIVTKSGDNILYGNNVFLSEPTAFILQDELTGKRILFDMPARPCGTAGCDASGNNYKIRWPSGPGAAGTNNVVRVVNTATTATLSFDTPLWTVPEGGLGVASLPAHSLLVGNDAGTPSFLAPGTTGSVVRSNGTDWEAGKLTLTNIDSSVLLGAGIKLLTGTSLTASKCLRTDSGGAIVSSADDCGTGSGGVLSLSGTANQVSVSGPTGAVIVSLPSTVALSTLTASGNIGIGTASPSKRLSIEGNTGSVVAQIFNQSTTGVAEWVGTNDSGKQIEVGVVGSSRPTYGALTANDGFLYNNSSITLMSDNVSGVIKFATGGNTERMRLDSAGLLTLNTTNYNDCTQLLTLGAVVTCGSGERLLSSYASFAAAVTAIGSTPTTLVINSVATIATNTTVPATLNLRFTGSGQLSPNTGVVVTFADGTRIEAPATKQIFAGLGTVKFTGAYPDYFYPGWWGAVFDDNGTSGTDDLAAFNAMQNSMQRVALNILNSSGPYLGGKVKLPDGKFAYMSDTFHIRRPLSIIGSEAEYTQPTTGFRFAANKTGFIVHATSTFDGTNQTLLTANQASFEGFSLYGGQGANNTVLTINGLTITLTGGSITSVARNGNAGGTIPAIAPGSTILVDGYNYVVGPTLSSTATATIPIDAPRIYIIANGSTTVTEAAGTQSFPTANDWVGQAVEFKDLAGKRYGPFTVSSMTSTTLVLNTTLASGLYTGKVTNGSVNLTGKSARLNIYHGIDARITSKYKNITIQQFAGNGWQCHSDQLPSFYPGGEPNCNNAWLDRVNSIFNSGSGVVFHGINANNHSTRALNIENNKGYGLYEDSLGGNHYSFHMAYNGQGPFFTGVGSTMMTDSYTEGGQASGIIGAGAIVSGGNHGASFDYDTGYSTYTGPDGQGQFESRSGLAFRRSVARMLGVDNPKAFLFNIGTPNQPNTLMGFGAAEEAINLSSGGSATYALKPVYQLGYDQFATGWYSLYYGGSYSTDQAASVIAMSGSNASVGGGKLAFPTGFTTGSGGTQITKIVSATASLNFTALAANTCEVLTITVTGAADGDIVSLGVPTALADVDGATESTAFFGWVSATNTVSVRRCNVTGTVTADPAAATVRATITRF